MENSPGCVAGEGKTSITRFDGNGELENVRVIFLLTHTHTYISCNQTNANHPDVIDHLIAHATLLWRVCLRHASLDITYDIARNSVNRINKTHRPFRQTVLFSRRGDYFDRPTRGSRRLFRSFRENASIRDLSAASTHRQNKTRAGYVTDIGRVRRGVARWFSFLERTSRTVLFHHEIACRWIQVTNYLHRRCVRSFFLPPPTTISSIYNLLFRPPPPRSSKGIVVFGFLYWFDLLGEKPSLVIGKVYACLHFVSKIWRKGCTS